MPQSGDGFLPDSAPASDIAFYGYDNLLNVNTICCSLSLVGAMVMIVPFLTRRSLRKLRHKLILCLAINDACLALAACIPTIGSQIGHDLIDNSSACKADAFFYLTFLVAASCWALSIAGCTYVVIVLPMSNAARWLHHSIAIPLFAVLIWSACVINAAFGILLEDTKNVGGFCFFPTTPGKFYGNLVVFIPRTLAFSAIVSIYIKLYLFLRRQGKQTLEVGSYDLDAALDVVESKSVSGKQRLAFPNVIKEALPSNMQPAFQAPLSHSHANPGSSAVAFRAIAYQTGYGSDQSGDSQHTLTDSVARMQSGSPCPTSENGYPADRIAEEIAYPQESLSQTLSCSSPSSGGRTSRSTTSRRGRSPPQSMNIVQALATAVPDFNYSSTLKASASSSPNQLLPSERNKRAAYLMMLYPVAYSVIMALSFGRILSSLITGVGSAARLSLLSRILVLSIGAIDALIYTIIEWRVRATGEAAGASIDMTRFQCSASPRL